MLVVFLENPQVEKSLSAADVCHEFALDVQQTPMVKQFLANLVAAALKTSACDFFGKIPKNPTMKTPDAPCGTDFLCMPFEIHESDFLKKPEGGSKNQQEKTANLDEQRLKMVSSAYSGKNTFLFPNFFKNCTPPKTPTW